MRVRVKDLGLGLGSGLTLIRRASMKLFVLRCSFMSAPAKYLGRVSVRVKMRVRVRIRARVRVKIKVWVRG
jgi:hypothetical protein